MTNTKNKCAERGEYPAFVDGTNRASILGVKRGHWAEKLMNDLDGPMDERVPPPYQFFDDAHDDEPTVVEHD